MMFTNNRSIILHVYLCSMLSMFLFFNIHIQGCTPLHIASLWGNYETVELLLILGADMDITDTQVLCYLHILFIQSAYLFNSYGRDDIRENKHKNIIWIIYILVLSLY